MSRPEIDRALCGLHAEVDREAARLERIHRDRLQCGKGCRDCCVDGITVFAVEAERIRARHDELLARGRPHPRGACAFLDADGACRIYEDRPYVCRTQGLPLRWIGEGRDGEAVEYRDICPLNAPGPGVERLAERECWSLGPVEGRLVALERRRSGGPEERIALRALFSRGGG